MKLSEAKDNLEIGARVLVIQKSDGSIHSAGTLTKATGAQVVVVQRRRPGTYNLPACEDQFEIVKYR